MSINKNRKTISIFLVLLLSLSLITTPLQSVAYAVSADQNVDAEEVEEVTETETVNEQEESATEEEVVDPLEEEHSNNEESTTENEDTTQEEAVNEDEEVLEEDSPEAIDSKEDSEQVEEEASNIFNPDTYEIEVETTTTGNSITVTWENNQEVDGFEMLLDYETVETVTDTNTYTFTGLNAGEWYEIGIHSLVDGEIVDYYYEGIEVYWSDEELVPVSIIFMFNEDPNYDEYVRIRGIDDGNKGFILDDWIYSDNGELLLPPGKLEVLVYDTTDFSVQEAHQIEIEEGKDYINNPIQLQYRLKEMREAAEPFEFEVTDVTEDSISLKWNEVSKITGFEIGAYSEDEEDDFHWVETQEIVNNVNEYTLTKLNPNLTYYINFYSHYVNDLRDYNGFRVKTVGADAEAPKVPFANDTVHKATAEELGIYFRDVTQADILKLSHLDLWNVEVNSLEGLQYAENLEHLYGYNNNITDINVLKNLTELKDLGLYDNNISDITALQNLTNLRHLDLGWNDITSVDSLANLTNLYSLNLSNNNITNIDALNQLTNLEYLYLHSNTLEDITALSNLTELRGLDLGSNEISNIDVLANFSNLEWLHLSYNQIEDITALADMGDLETLSLYSNHISDITALEELENLWSLDLSNNNIANIDSLANLTNLEDLSLNENNISDISALKDLVNLQHLDLSYNNITDISVLKELPNLQYVYLYGNDITDTETIQYLRNDGVEVYYDGEDDWNDWEDEDWWHDWDGEVDLEEVLQTFPEEQGFVVSEDGRHVSLDLSGMDAEETVELTPEQTRVLIENGQTIEVKKDGVETAIPASAFDNYDEPVSISVVETEPVPNSLSSTYDFTIKQGSRNISTFEEGVTLTFNVNADRAKNPNNLKVFYFNEDTQAWERIGGTYSNGKVTVVTYHFSIYTVFEAADEESEEIVPVETPEEESPVADEEENKEEPVTEEEDNKQADQEENKEQGNKETENESTKLFPKDQGFVVDEKENRILFDVNKQSGNETLVLSPDQVAYLVGIDAIIIVKNNNGKVYIPASIFNNSYEQVTISVVKMDAVPNSVSDTYDFTLTQGDQTISVFEEGIVLAFDVNTDIVDDVNNLKVFYLNEETQEWENIGGYYIDGKVMAVTDHFSTFTVFEVVEEEIIVKDQQPTEGNKKENDLNVPENDNDTLTTETSKDAGKADSNTSNKLPNTATNMFNTMLIGLILLIIGGVAYVFKREKQKA